MGNSLNGRKSLTPAEFDELCQSTKLTCVEIDEWYRDFVSKFKNGIILRCQFKKVYQELFPNGDSDEFCDHIFRLYDIDGNGHITFAEFVTMLHVSAHGTAEQKLKSMFRLYDVDKNGIVTIVEIICILKNVYIANGLAMPTAVLRAHKHADVILRALDTDNDRQLVEEEFLHAALTCPDIADMLSGKYRMS